MLTGKKLELSPSLDKAQKKLSLLKVATLRYWSKCRGRGDKSDYFAYNIRVPETGFEPRRITISQLRMIVMSQWRIFFLHRNIDLQIETPRKKVLNFVHNMKNHVFLDRLLLVIQNLRVCEKKLDYQETYRVCS